MITHDLVADIRQYRADNRLSLAGLAIKAGLHSNALRNLEKPNWNPHLDTLTKLEAVVYGEEDR